MTDELGLDLSWIKDELGESLVAFIEALSDDATRSAWRTCLEDGDWYLYLSPVAGVARLYVFGSNGSKIAEHTWTNGVRHRKGRFTSKVERVTVLPGALFLTAGDLWKDSKEHTHTTSVSSQSPASIGPEMEEAATPARVTASVRANSRELSNISKTDSKGERGMGQRVPSSRARDRHPTLWSNLNEHESASAYRCAG